MRLLAGRLAAAVALGCAAAAQRTVVVVLDDVGASDLAIVRAAGFAPSIDALAASGVEFTRCYSNPVCVPSRYSMIFGTFHGKEPGLSCGTNHESAPPQSLTSLFELDPLVPSALVGKWHLGPNPITGQPWELAPQAHGAGAWRAGTADNPNSPSCASNDYRDWIRVDDGISTPTTEYNPRAQRDAALAILDSTPGPLLLVVELNLAHGPFHRPDADLLPPGYPPTPTARARYEAMIAAADSVVGAVASRLDLQQDAVLVVGDNGTPINAVAPGQDPGRVKATTFEGGVRVPLIAAGLGLSGGTDGRLCHVVDAYATVAFRLGVTWQGDGRSLFGTPRLTPVVCDNHSGSAQGGWDRAAVGPRYKLRRVGTGAAPSEELYDLLLDPGELANQVANPALASQLASLRAALDDYEARP